MALFFEWEHFAAGGAHTGGGVRQIHPGQATSEPAHGTTLIASGSIGLLFGQSRWKRSGASLAQNSIPDSPVHPFTPHRAPAAPSPEPMLDESAKMLAAELARRDACAGRMGC